MALGAIPDEMFRPSRLTLSNVVYKSFQALHFDFSPLTQGLAAFTSAVFTYGATTAKSPIGRRVAACVGGFCAGTAVADAVAGFALRRLTPPSSTPIGDAIVAKVGKPRPEHGRRRLIKVAAHYASVAQLKYPRETVMPDAAERAYVANRISRLIEDDKKELVAFHSATTTYEGAEELRERRGAELRRRVPITRNTRHVDLALVLKLATNLYFTVSYDDMWVQQVASSNENRSRVEAYQGLVKPQANGL